MKILVDTVQMLVIAAMIYPVFYLWDINKVDEFCSEVEAGTTKQVFLQIADEPLIKLIEPKDDERPGRWTSSVVTWSPFSSYSCEVRGYGSVVSSAWIEEA